MENELANEIEFRKAKASKLHIGFGLVFIYIT